MILGVSIAFFIGLGALQWELELVLILVPILLVHELGHYIAMKAFGYKNIHMFFIPLLGAAVSGRNYRVGGWKKSIVSLAGPLPSIALGLILGGVGMWTDNQWCLKGAIITLILNVMNLAPFLPLDGGHVAHITLFSRSNLVDLLFRVGTIALLIGVATLLKAKLLFGFGVVMMIGLPTVWRTMKATERVRHQDLPQPTNDAMPVEAIHAVVAAIGQSNLPTQGTATLAKLTLSVYENVIVRPPNWPTTLAIWGLYSGGLVAGLVGMIAISFTSLSEGWFDVDREFQTHYQRVDLKDVGDNLEAVTEAMAELARNDPRFDSLQDSEWSSAFYELDPELIVVIDPERAQEVVDACQQMPLNVGPYAPIGLWTPKTRLSDEQIELQAKLRVLQGASEETPWATIKQVFRDEPGGESSSEGFREFLKQSAEQAQQNRSDWIRAQADSTTGTTKRLYNAYCDYEIAAETWREDERTLDKKGPPPQLPEFLAPLLTDLGYLSPEHPAFSTSLTMNAYQVDMDSAGDLITKDFPLVIGDQAVVHLYINPTQDFAAAYACIHDWLKTKEIQSVVWTYETLAKTE